MEYTKVKSNFIKKKLKNASWEKDREYIDDLIFIERWILGEAWGMGASMRWTQVMKDKYTKEIQEIGTELDPKRYKDFYKKHIKEEAKLKKEYKRILREEKEEEQDKKEWIKAKGKR